MSFAKRLLSWYKVHGRHDLPWQKNPTPYRVWISEIMLQQTQVATVIPYYNRFMKSFPSLKSLANADIDSVLSHWSGLGYYARARNIHKAAKKINDEHNSRFPRTIEALCDLPGIGRSTAGAIASFAMNLPTCILDGNVKRVITRFYAIEGWPGKTEVTKELWKIVEEITPRKNTNHYNQAIMDLGATLCTRSKPKCDKCPLVTDCKAYSSGKQTAFPTRKPAKEKPNKQVYSLILKRSDGSILLERRPPVGIWGGLWSFPECTIETDIDEYCEKLFKSKVTKQDTWEPIYHQFSHYSLEIKPIVLEITQELNHVMDSEDQIWYKISHHLPGGIAAPVKRILKLYEEAYEPHDLL